MALISEVYVVVSLSHQPSAVVEFSIILSGMFCKEKNKQRGYLSLVPYSRMPASTACDKSPANDFLKGTLAWEGCNLFPAMSSILFNFLISKGSLRYMETSLATLG